jgi:hypothetical protein
MQRSRNWSGLYANTELAHRNRLLVQGVVLTGVALMGAAIGLNAQVAVLALAAAVTVCLAWFRPNILIILIPVSVLLPYETAVFVGGQRVSITDGLLLVLLLITLGTIAVRRVRLRSALLGFPMLAFAMASAGAALASGFWLAMGLEAKRWAVYSALPLCAFVIWESRSWTKARVGFVIVSLVLAIGSLLPSLWLGTGSGARAVSLLYSPNTLGWVSMLLGLWFTAHWAEPGQAASARMLSTLATLAAVVTLGLSGSLGAVLGFAAGLCSMSFRSRPDVEGTSPTRRKTLLAAVVLLSISVFVSPGLRDRFQALLPGSAGGSSRSDHLPLLCLADGRCHGSSAASFWLRHRQRIGG